ncbi:hypothetical protein PT974_12410 [Cladobotryum mycophilum]|uniref:Uncharacterized protein n=1 Tax=Cladobotryum mycophilum TaxID=491253 RepID=A0ABR0S7X0_9HYPO
MVYSWISGEGESQFGDINPRGWGQFNFSSTSIGMCDGYNSGCQCEQCLVEFERDNRPLIVKIQERHKAWLQHRKRSGLPQIPARSSATPLCRFTPVVDLLLGSGSSVTTSTPLVNAHDECEPWEGQLIWGSTRRADFLAYAASWTRVSSELARYIPTSSYPSLYYAGHRAPFIDIGLGSNLLYFWALELDWDTQFSAALVTSITSWADMADGGDMPKEQVAKIFDVLPSLVRACTTGYHDNLSPMKVLAIECLRAPTIPIFHGPLPSVRDIWLSRMADAGARESAILMTGCASPFSDRRSAEDTRLLVTWALIHDLFDLPRDLSHGNHVNGVLWALFAGFTGGEILVWLRDSVASASRSDSCAAKLVLCMAFPQVTGPRWSVNGLALDRLSEWPKPPLLPARHGGMLPLFLEQGGSKLSSDSMCKCTWTNESRSLGAAAAEALSGTAACFTSVSDRLDAHSAGLAALIAEDWNTLIDLQRTAWSTFLSDLEAIAGWLNHR